MSRSPLLAPSRRLVRLVAPLAAMLAASLPAGHVDAQQPVSAAAPAPLPVHRERLRGRVSAAGGEVVPGAEVVATRAPDRAVFRGTTGTDGRYEIVVDSGTGDYLLYVAPSAATLRAARKRIGRAAPGDTILETDLVLPAATAATLAPVRVTAQPPRVTRAEPAQPVRGNEQEVNPGELVLPPDALGDYAAIGARLPGARATADGYSVLGVGGSQNAVTLNGLAIPATALPREAATSASVATTAYDPAIGWFGGTQTAIALAAGRTFSDRRASLSTDAPMLQATPGARAPEAASFTRVTAGLGGSGMALFDRAAYSYGLQASVRRADAPTLASLGADAREALGLSGDTLARFWQALDASGIPRGVAGGGQETRSASFLARLNTPERDLATYDERPTSTGVIAFGLREETRGSYPGPLAVGGGEPSLARTAGSLQWVYSSFRRQALLGELRSGVTVSDMRRAAGSALPAGQVLVGASDPGADAAEGGAGALATLRFGGPGAGSMAERRVTWHSQGEARYVSRRAPTHRLKLTADTRYDAVTRRADAGSAGAFSYASLADLEAQRPTGFVRTLGGQEGAAGAWNGALALGDLWRPSRSVRLLLGARAEATAFTERAPLNPALRAALGVRTDYVPDALAVSPRLGFSWNTGRGAGTAGREGFSRINLTSLGVVRGGIGEFRALAGPELVAGRIGQTGLAGGVRTLRCIGDAVPLADWAAYGAGAAAPTRCADGAPALADSAPTVQLIDRGYRTPRSWRANLAWGAAAGPLAWSTEAIVSLNRHQPALVDHNVSTTPRFIAADEGREVLVPVEGIVPSTGAVSAALARLAPGFGAVRALTSDGRSIARQLAVALAPNLGGDPPVTGRVTYTLGHVRERANGFTQAAVGSPFAATWARSDLDVRHSVDLQLDARARGWATFTLWGRASSGAPFTPMVGDDVNGDGYANDRAFVVAPTAAQGDPALRRDMTTLLATAPDHVRRCLERQLGRMAGRNSCEGPWTATLDASLGIDARRLGLGGRRVTVTLYLQNLLAGGDLLFGGDGVSRWSAAAPDPTLYRVRGFDAETQRFAYEMNPRFGTTHAAAGLPVAPFRATLDVRINLGTPYPVQQVDRFLRPGRGGHPGTRLDVAALKKRYARSVPDPYARVLAESDSLLLRPEQARALMEAQRAFAGRMDSAWTLLASAFAALPDDFDASAALREQEAATQRVWNMARDEIQAVLPKVLDPRQLVILPYPASMLLEARGPVRPQFRGFN